MTAGFTMMRRGLTPLLSWALLVAMVTLVAIASASIMGDLGPDGDGDGIPDAVEISQGTNPAVKDNDVFANHRLLAMQVYRDFLGREGDPGGLGYWQGQLDAGMDPVRFIEQIQELPEFQARVAPVIRLYLVAFNRRPDHAGLTYWVRQFAGGMPLNDIGGYFAASGEFNATYGALSNRQFIELLYLNSLQRSGDASGIDYWTAGLDSGLRTRGQVLVAFSESAEHVVGSAPEVLVAMAYAGMMNRTADVAGYDFWVDHVIRTGDRQGLLRAFYQSQEYHDRFLPAPVAPVITSANAATFNVSTPGTFTVTATGSPAPTLSVSGALPAGVTFNPSSGVLSGTPAAGTAGTYPLTFTAANGVPPNATQGFTLTVSPGVAITSAPAATFTVGAAGTFMVTTASSPVAATISHTGALPAGVTFVNNGNGTATLSGTPGAGTGGAYPITITASNGAGPNGTQSFTLTVNQPPAITSGNAATFPIGTASTHTVTASGFPAPTLSMTGTLPTGVTFNAATGVLSGTPAAGTGGSYPLVFTAANGVVPDATQSFALTVNQAPVITSANAVTFTAGAAGTFTVTTTGVPSGASMIIGAAGALPAGVNFTSNGNGTATLSGTPGAGTGGTYPLTITANNGVAPNATQSFTLTVGQAPAITSGNSTTFTAGAAGSFTVTATGFPAPTYSATGALPSGVTLNPTTGALSGTPAAGTGGSYPITITASNGVAPNATQGFTLAVNQAPAITSANAVTFNVGTPGTFTVTTTGFPAGAAMAIGATGALPAGVTFTNNNDGTATLAGTPGVGTAQPYPLTITANNGVAPNATQGFTLTVTDTTLAVDDAYTVVHDLPGGLVVAAPGILGNDTGTPGPTLSSVTGTGAPCTVFPCTVATTNGSVTVQGNGGFTYTPAASFAGTDTFTYVATNAAGNDGATVTITVTNTLPVVDLDGAATGGIAFGPVTFTEGDPPVAVVGTIVPDALTLTDSDGTTLAGATLVLTNVQDTGVESLALLCPSGPAPVCSGAIQTTDIVSTSTPATYTIAITRVAPLADYEALLRTLTYQNTSQDPTVSPNRDITVTVDDGIADNNPVAHATVAVVAVNDAPVLAGIEAGALTYSVGGPAVAVTSSLTVSDVDSANLAGATVQITGNCVSADDALSFAPQNGISGTYTAATCLMTLSGSATVANYQAALRDVRYQNTNMATSTATRTVSFTANDGAVANNLSNVVTRNVTVQTNGAPVLTAGGTLAYTENQSAAPIDLTVTVTDADSPSLIGATAQITGNCASAEDVLSFTPQNGITATYSAATCTMTLAGSSSVANYRTALRSVAYSNSSENPSTLARTVTWQVNDGGAVNNLSNTPTSTINVAASNDAPVLTAGGTLGYTENGPAAAINASVTVTDADSANLAGATVQITANCNNAQDVLAFTNQNGISGTYSAASCLMTLSGSATVANYQAALRSVTYANTSENPTTASRTVTWIANDGALPSTAVTSTITVTAVNDAPVLAAIEVAALAYTENAAATPITATLTVADVDSANLAGATVVITANCAAAEDVLSFTTQNGITGAYTAGTCTMALSGSASLASYQTALRSVAYVNTSENPSTLARTVTFQVNDGGAPNNLSNTVTRNVTVTAVNDPPTATGFAGLPAQAGIPITYPAGKLTGTDPEGTAVSIDTTAINVTNGTVTINADGSFTFTPLPLAATASFQYRVTDSGSPAPNQNSAYATVGFTVTGPAIFFVKNPAVGAANCTLGNECLFATAITTIGGTPNTSIFISDAGTHTAGSTLNSGADVIGQGITGTSFDTYFGIGAPAQGTLAGRPATGQPRPTVTAAGGTTLIVGLDNTLRGFNLGNSAGTGLLGISFGTLALSDMLINTAGQALNLNTGTLTATLDSVTSAGGTNNVNLNAVAGTLTMNGGALSGATGNGFNVVGGTGTITYNGTVASGTARSVSVASKSGGTVTFGGTVTDTDTGVSLTNNTGATIAFTNTITANTGANAAFTATGGGTLSATGSGSTLATTTGTALNVANTTIGTGGITFRSISSNGAPSGIVLNNTGGTAGLTVTGDGGGASNGSGGAIQNSTGIGVNLISTRDVSLGYLNVTGSADSGIKGISVTNFTLNRSNVTSNGNSTSDEGIQFGEFSGATVGVTGTVSITNSNVSGNAHNNFHLRNTSGTISSFTVTNSSFSNLNDTFGANAFLFEMSLTAVTTAASITNSTFANNSPQRALEVQAHDTATIGSGGSTFNVSNNTFNDNGIHASFTQDGSANLTFTFQNNGTALSPMVSTVLAAVNVFSSATSTGGTIRGRIQGNFIGSAATTTGGSAVRAVIQGRTAATLLIDSNTVRHVGIPGNGSRGFDIEFLGPTATGLPITTSDVTISNNDVDNLAPATDFPLAAIYLAADNQGSPAAVRANVFGNNARNSLTGGSYDYPSFDGNGAQLIYAVVTAGATGQLVGSGAATPQLQSGNPATTAARIFTTGITMFAGPVNTPP